MRGSKDFGGGAAEELLVQLGEFSGYYDGLGGTEGGGDVGKGFEDAMRRLVEDVGVGGAGEGFEGGAAGSGF